MFQHSFEALLQQVLEEVGRDSAGRDGLTLRPLRPIGPRRMMMSRIDRPKASKSLSIRHKVAFFREPLRASMTKG